jgi:hypothetical protein
MYFSIAYLFLFLAYLALMYAFLCQRLNTATSSPADDVNHYVIHQNLLDFLLNTLPVFMRQWEKRKGCSLSGRWEPTLPYQRSHSIHGDFSSVTFSALTLRGVSDKVTSFETILSLLVIASVNKN